MHYVELYTILRINKMSSFKVEFNYESLQVENPLDPIHLANETI